MNFNAVARRAVISFGCGMQPARSALNRTQRNVVRVLLLGVNMGFTHSAVADIVLTCFAAKRRYDLLVLAR